ncbi:hypothetical protein ABKN59_010425 [Abortiporus biennis]
MSVLEKSSTQRPQNNGRKLLSKKSRSTSESAVSIMRTPPTCGHQRPTSCSVNRPQSGYFSTRVPQQRSPSAPFVPQAGYTQVVPQVYAQPPQPTPGYTQYPQPQIYMHTSQTQYQSPPQPQYNYSPQQQFQSTNSYYSIPPTSPPPNSQTSVSELRPTNLGGPPGTSSPSQVISKEDEFKRLFTLCETGKGNASLLHEAVVFAKPEDLKEKGLIEEFLTRCHKSQELICSQIAWASTEAERSRRSIAPKAPETREENLLASLLDANEELLEAIKMYHDLERIGKDQEERDRKAAERKLKAFTVITEFQPTAAETTLVDQIFGIADTQRKGSITGHAAAKIFSGSRLPPTVLAGIWEIANVEESEVLSKQCVGVALRLIGHAQLLRQPVDESYVLKAGPLAHIEGLDPVINDSSGAGPSSSLPPLTKEDCYKFLKIYNSSNPENGVLSGERARGVMMKSRLPMAQLAQIWELADTQHRGALDTTSFVVAMYLIQGVMSGTIPSIPSRLPPSIYLQASLAPDIPPPPPPKPSYAPLSPVAGSSGSSAIASSSTSVVWDVSPELKRNADEFFDLLDEHKHGYLDEKSTRAHLSQIGLSKAAVAQIWSLADMNKDGNLSQDEFAVVLYLAQLSESGRPLPSSMPRTLIPPSSRPASQQQASDMELLQLIDFNNAPPQSPTSPVRSTPVSPTRSNNIMISLPPRSSSLLDSDNPMQPIPVHRIDSNSYGDPFSDEAASPTSPRPASVPLASSSSRQMNASGDALPSTIPSDWNWDVTPKEKARADRFFDMLDPWKNGYIEGEAAVPFLSKSKLEVGVLEKIWDLADADSDGRLSKEDFAIAMHLVKEKLAGKDLPETLPTSLTPPSTRPGGFFHSRVTESVEEEEPEELPSLHSAEPRQQQPPEVRVVPPPLPPRISTPPPPYTEMQEAAE